MYVTELINKSNKISNSNDVRLFPTVAGDYVQAALTLQRAAYRRANGGSRAPSLTEDAVLRYAEGAAQPPKAS